MDSDPFFNPFEPGYLKLDPPRLSSRTTGQLGCRPKFLVPQIEWAWTLSVAWCGIGAHCNVIQEVAFIQHGPQSVISLALIVAYSYDLGLDLGKRARRPRLWRVESETLGEELRDSGLLDCRVVDQLSFERAHLQNLGETL